MAQNPAAGLEYGESLRLHYPNEWWATQDAYGAWDQADGSDRVGRLIACRSYAWFARHKLSGQVKVISSACKLRWCPLCAQARANFLSRSVRSWYYTARNAKLLTLTLRHSDQLLEDQIDELYAGFRKLRRSAYIKSRTNGGIWFFQIKWSPKTNAWHPHIHALLDGGFIPQAEIRQRWAKYTGGSDIVDIRACYSPGSAANHVARYATRPGTLNKVPQENRLELLQALHGRRIVGAWGTAKSVPLAPPKCIDKDEWMFIGSWHDVQTQQETSKDARAILFAWQTGYSIGAHVTMSQDHPYEVDRPFMKDAQGNEYYNQSIFDP